MYNFLQEMLNWSEVWAPLIPLFFLLFKQTQPRYVKPVILYLIIAFFINLTGDIIADYKRYLPDWMQSNNPLYNVHSFIRFICFSLFFKRLNQKSFSRLQNILTVLTILLIIFNFIYLEDFTNPAHLSGNLLATEAYLLMIFCMLYYLIRLRDDESDLAVEPHFWIVTGLSIYVVINFFVFLFYVPMITQDPKLALNIWNVHNIAYILLCIFITKAIYVSPRHQLAI
jgi:hypothetical protein